jgi:asparagine synthase (glutamine-hydrolysing)
MCGIAGILHTNNEAVDRDTLIQMRDRMVSRGPDDAGLWTDSNVGLAHRRLSILDISELGHQPMVDEQTGSVIAYNGEIYNFRQIRKQLVDEGVFFASQCDTEVVLKAYRVWGTNCLDRFNGMFAFAIWDANKRAFFLARDRVGIKPLYYYLSTDLLLFASRLKALLAHSDCPRQIDPEALGLYLDLGFVPAPWSIFQNVRKLEPGHFLWVEAGAIHNECYWSANDTPIDESLRTAPEEELTERLETLLRESVDMRMISDVPLGAFLSGGVDSSAVVAMMSNCSSMRPRTYTIGFREDDYNEADFARETSRILGTEHHESVMGKDELIDLIDDIKEHYDEPFADSSNLPTMMVSRFAREHVTVCLSGDGGDELFAGYPQYRILSVLRHGFNLPKPIRRGLGHLLTKTGNHRRILLGNSLLQGDVLGSFAYIRSISKDFEKCDLDGSEGLNAESLFRSSIRDMPTTDAVSQAGRLDLRYYLVDDILQKLDVASMSTSLEARVPILDHRVVEFALSLPICFKQSGKASKRILKSVLSKYMPENTFARPKSGFEVPLADWFRGPLREMLQDGLSEARVSQFGMLNVKTVRRLVDLHLSGRRNTHPMLWALLSVMNWSDRLKRW